MATVTKSISVAAPSAAPSHPRNIVPTLDFVAHGVSPVVDAPPPFLSNHGGPVLQSVQVVPIYWGAAWSTGTNTSLPGQLDAFFDSILTSSLIDLLGEYSTGSTAIGHGSRLTSVSITTSEPGTANPTGGGRTVTDSQLQTALQGFINAGTVPAVTANTLYFLYLPPNVSVQQSSTSSSCSQFCGYHSSFGSGIYYAVIPFANCSGCQFPGAFLDTLTEVSSHELCEAITDPALNAWWDSNSGNEIGDICNRQTTRMGNFLVQTEWSNEQNACVFAPLLPTANSHIDGYSTEFNRQQHVNFVGSDNHVHELFYTDQWHHNDLTTQAGAPPAAPSSAIDGYSTGFNGQQHVNYIGDDAHVHELFFTGSWQHNDLTVAAGAPVAGSSRLDGYETSFNQQQHVNFIGTDNHVHELFFDGSWHPNDLTLAAGAPAAVRGSAIAGYQTDWNQQQHVIFVTPDGHINELFFTGSWQHNDLTVTTGDAPLAMPDGPLDGYVTAFNQQQHINYISQDHHVCELFYDGGYWHSNDLTAVTGAPPTAGRGSDLAGYQTDWNRQQHVLFVDDAGRIWELYYNDVDGHWHPNDLTTQAQAPFATLRSPIDGYATAFNQQQHVNFIAADNHIHELFYTDAWRHNDLTVL